MSRQRRFILISWIFVLMKTVVRDGVSWVSMVNQAEIVST